MSKSSNGWKLSESKANELSSNSLGKRRREKQKENKKVNEKREEDHHIKISIFIVHKGHVLNNILEITINNGQETMHIGLTTNAIRNKLTIEKLPSFSFKSSNICFCSVLVLLILMLMIASLLQSCNLGISLH